MATDFTMKFLKEHGRLPSPTRQSQLLQAVENAKQALLLAEIELEKEQKLAAVFNEELYAQTRIIGG